LEALLKSALGDIKQTRLDIAVARALAELYGSA